MQFDLKLTAASPGEPLPIVALYPLDLSRSIATKVLQCRLSKLVQLTDGRIGWGRVAAGGGGAKRSGDSRLAATTMTSRNLVTTGIGRTREVFVSW